MEPQQAHFTVSRSFLIFFNLFRPETRLGAYVNSAPGGHLVLKWRRMNVDATSSRRIDVNTTSF